MLGPSSTVHTILTALHPGARSAKNKILLTAWMGVLRKVQHVALPNLSSSRFGSVLQNRNRDRTPRLICRYVNYIFIDLLALTNAHSTGLSLRRWPTLRRWDLRNFEGVAARHHHILPTSRCFSARGPGGGIHTKLKVRDDHHILSCARCSWYFAFSLDQEREHLWGRSRCRMVSAFY